jgi:GNAT superfamily N-acetyltransferase
MPATRIEPVTPANFPVLLQLIDGLAHYEHLDPPDAAARGRLYADAFSDPPRYEAFLAMEGDEPAGYVTFYLTYSTFLARPSLYLEDIYVREEFRHRGIGRELFRFCRDIARERGCGRMDWQVLTWNEPAIRFYENAGGKRLDWYAYRIGPGEL